MFLKIDKELIRSVILASCGCLGKRQLDTQQKFLRRGEHCLTSAAIWSHLLRMYIPFFWVRESIANHLNVTSIKTVGIFFAPILIPRALTFYRTLRSSIKQRPDPRPLPELPRRAINVLFFACFFFLILSLPFNPHAPSPNIFAQTSSKLTTSTQLLFTRLARFRPDELLTAEDELLRSKLVTPLARKIYLRFGEDTLVSCAFCSLDNPNTYLLYHLPFHTLLPHLFHLFIVGVVTSAPLVGEQTSGWRNKFVLLAVSLALLDVYLVATIDPTPGGKASNRAPWSFHNDITPMRSLVFALVDAIFAFLIYVSSTNRFFYTPPTAAEQAEAAASTASSTLTTALAKLRTVSLTRHAVVRDRTLKARDDGYWRTVAEMEKSAMENRGSGEAPSRPPGSVWEEREVVDAISKVMQGQGQAEGMDLAQVGIEAEEHISGATAGLDVEAVENPAA